MYSRFQLARKYLYYYITASNGKGHGIHSPFVFEFVQKVLNGADSASALSRISALRKELKRDPRLVEIEDFGAGSSLSKTNIRTIGNIAKNASKPSRYGRLFYRLVEFYQSRNILELGTSLGLSTAYFAAANPSGSIYTMEGAQSLASLAKNNFKRLGLTNIQLILGPFDQNLGVTLQQSGKLDLVFVDGNHRREPTLRYFHQLLGNIQPSAVLIFDDIHWSHDMELAWEEIKLHPDVLLTIDLFFIGFVIFRPEFKVKQHFTIRF